MYAILSGYGVVSVKDLSNGRLACTPLNGSITALVYPSDLSPIPERKSVINDLIRYTDNPVVPTSYTFNQFVEAARSVHPVEWARNLSLLDGLKTIRDLTEHENRIYFFLVNALLNLEKVYHETSQRRE